MKILEKIFWVIIIAVVAYGIICYADILAHNLSGGSENSWNIFLRALDNAQKI